MKKQVRRVHKTVSVLRYDVNYYHMNGSDQTLKPRMISGGM